MKKHHKKAWKALRQIAKREGVSVDYVTEHIEQAVKEAYMHAQIIGDERVLGLWAKIPREGALPNAVEMIEYMGS